MRFNYSLGKGRKTMDEQLLIGIMMLVLAVSLPVEWGIEKWKKRARRKAAPRQNVICLLPHSRSAPKRPAV